LGTDGQVSIQNFKYHMSVAPFSFKSLRATGTLAAVISQLLNGNGIMSGRGILHFDVFVFASGVEWWIVIVGS